MKHKFGIALHGGAGTLHKELMTDEMQGLYTTALQDAMNQGYAVLLKGGSAVDAVEAAIVSLEDCPLYNAGKGSVFNNAGKHEMDASIMSGSDLAAGAVSLVRNVKNPISLAVAIMRKSEHVYLAGDGAEAFAHKMDLAFEEDPYFYDEFRYKQWLVAQQQDGTFLDHNIQINSDKKFGTVGAVALDVAGNLAAGTSTGGMTNKKFGRIGDSPIIGAGTYANNDTCAISCTGHGELFIRSVVGHDISSLMEYKGLTLAEACHEVVMNKLVKIGGEGGLVAIDKHGNIELSFNSEGMYRAMKSSDGSELVAIYK